VKGAEQQELVEFARKVLEQAEKNGDIFKPAPSGARGKGASDDSSPQEENAPQPLAGELCCFICDSFFKFLIFAVPVCFARW
jgi:hypothetical protein